MVRSHSREVTDIVQNMCKRQEIFGKKDGSATLSAPIAVFLERLLLHCLAILLARGEFLH